MEKLVDANPDFTPLWDKLRSARCAVLSLMIADTEKRPSQEELDAACDTDRQFQHLFLRTMATIFSVGWREEKDTVR